jgi:hypothetical protein
MNQNAEKPAVRIGIDAGYFDEADFQAIMEQLQPNFRVSGGTILELSGPVDPHVVVEIFAAALPLADVYANLISSAL